MPLGRCHRRRWPQRLDRPQPIWRCRSTRARAGGAGTARRRLHAGEAVPRSALPREPVRLRHRAVDEIVVQELGLRRRGWSARSPTRTFGSRSRTAPLRPVARQREDAAPDSRRSGSARRTSPATGPTSTSSTRRASGCARAPATPGSVTARPAPRSRSSLRGEQMMMDIVFEASIAEVSTSI